MFKAVIFDFDGVIADTMTDNCVSWQSALAQQDILIEPLEYYLLEGMGRFQIADFFIEKYGLDVSLRQVIASAKEEKYAEINNFRIYNEIELILKYLRAKSIKIGLVTGASRSRIKTCLNEVFLDYFDYTVTADDVINSKPDPEPYLKALAKLDIIAEETIVVENAQLGIRSAKAAACTCYAIETTLDKSYLSESDEIFKNHSDLFQKFKILLG